MLPVGSDRLRPAVVGNPDARDALSGTSVNGYDLEVTSFDPGAETVDIPDRPVDCLVVDCDTVGRESIDIVSDWADDRPTLPVIVLVDEADRLATRALAAGATTTLPQCVVDADSGVFAETVVSIIGRESARSGIEDLYDSVTAPVTLCDPATGRLLDANERFCDEFGYAPEDIRSAKLAEVTADVPEIDGSHASDAIARASDGDSPVEFEWPVETAGEEVRWTESTLQAARFGGRDVVVWAATDVTERKRREREYEQIFNGVNDSIALRDPETGRLVDVNDSYADLLGYDREEMVGMSIGDVASEGPEYTDDRGKEIIDQVMSGDGPVEFEWQVETADGNERLMDVTATAATINGRERYLAIARDVTERRAYERQLRQERDRRSVLFENTPDPIMTVTFENGRPHITEVNAAFEEVFGFDADEVDDQPLTDVLVPDDEREQFERFRQQVLQGTPVEGEVRRKTADGSREFLLRVLPYDSNGERQAYVWYTDVTERKRRARMIRSLHDATEQLQEAETTEAACRAAVDAARDVLDLPMTACWLQRESPDGPVLEPVAATDQVREIDPAPFRPGDDEYDAFQEGKLLSYDPSDRFPENPLEAALVLPLGEHGLLGVGNPAVDEYDGFVRDAARTLAGHVTTALDRVTRAEQLHESERRFRAILDRIDETILFGPASELSVADATPEFVSSGYEDIYGLTLQEIHETYAEGFFGTLHPDEYDEYRAFVEGICRDVEQDDPESRYTREYRIERSDGELRWVHSDYYPMEWDDGTYKIVVVSRDVTDRKRRERTLESFHDATAEMTTADTVADAGGITVEAAAEVFELPSTAVYHYDSESGTLDPVACGPAIDADLPVLTAADGPAWTAFVEEGMCRLSTESVPALDIGDADEALLVPLGGTGLLVVWPPEGGLDADAANIIAATVEAAFNRLRGERELEARSEKLEHTAERARRLEAVTELVQRVEAAITTESSRRDVQRAVCNELTDVGPFEAAWIAEAGVGTDRLTPRTVDGVEHDHVETVLAREDGTGDTHPARDAWQTGEPSVVNDLLSSGPGSDWREAILKRGHGSLCAIPIAYRGVTHGVLTIVAETPEAFGDHELDVLDQLGTSIGHAIMAIERQRALESDNTLELELRGDGTDLPPARLARQTDCQVRHERTVRRQDGSVSVYYTVAGDLPAELEATAGETLPGTVDTVTRRTDEAVIERRGSSWFGSIISEYGGVLRRGKATPGGVTLVVELPQKADTRTLVDRVRDAYPGLELVAQRQHRETSVTPGELTDRLERRLSSRQYEALETAHAMGYFDWPRESSGEDVAEALDITQPTVNKHIRIGERKLFDLLFEKNPSDTEYTP